MIVAVAFGLGAAAVFAGAGALQHSVTRETALSAPPRDRVLPVLALVPRLLRHPLWLAGFVGNILGFLLHAAALHRGDITVIQVVLVGQLLFALPLGALRRHRSPIARDWLGTAAICAGIAALTMARSHVAQTVAAERDAYAVAVTGGSAMLACVLLARALAAPSARRFARRWSGLRTGLIGLAAGIGFSITAMCILVVTGSMADSGFDGLLDWPTVLLAASGLVAAVLAQDAFASGSFPAALTAMTIADPLATWVWGALFLDVGPDASTVRLAGYGLAALLVGSGVAVLAYSPTMAGGRTELARPLEATVSPAR